MHRWNMMELAWSFMATRFATGDGSPTPAKVLWIQEICTQLWHNYEVIAGKKITRNIIWDMTLTICYICFKKKQVQQLIHNDKTTMSSLYPLVCAFLFECSFASNNMFSHITHTHTPLVGYTPYISPCPKGCSLYGSTPLIPVWSHLTLDLLKALLTSCDHSDLFSATNGHGWVRKKKMIHTMARLKYVSSTCNIYTLNIYIYLPYQLWFAGCGINI